MKTLTVEEARRMALATGATLELNGKVFNASRRQVEVKPAKPELPPEPVASVPQPVPTPGVTHEEVERLLSERDAFWMAEMKRLTESIAGALSAQPSAQVTKPVEWTFKPVYDRDKVLQRIVATPTLPMTH